MEEQKMEKIKEEMLKMVYDFFVASNDFNGIGLRTIGENLNVEYKESIDIIKELVNEGTISIQSATNPHIVGYHIDSIENQKEFLEQAKNTTVTKRQFGNVVFVTENTSYSICVYPSIDYLKQHRNVSMFGNAVYTKMLALGNPQLKLVFFDIEVLDRYAGDPRYAFRFNEYSGDIYNLEDKEGSTVREEDQIFLKSFGLGYDELGNRLAVVSVRYLNSLSPEHQVYWMGKEYKGGGKVVREYYDNVVLGVWSKTYSVFSGFIGEQNCLNELAEIIFGKKLFNVSYERQNRPREFTFFFKPTRKNYLDFILLLDKMISDNINKDFFKGVIELDELVPLQDGVVERRSKGTLRLFQEWFLSEYPGEEEEVQRLFSVFKKIRKERQEPAHKITVNEYDKEYDKKQKEIIGAAYNAMLNLRHAFASHPFASGYEVPGWLTNGRVAPF